MPRKIKQNQSQRIEAVVDEQSLVNLFDAAQRGGFS
jgi:hypothetical protein